MTALKVPTVVPSLLAGDLACLGVQLDAVKAAGCTWVSVDVMDGHFVPNLSFGPDFVLLAKRHGFYVDAHLMVSNPLDVAPWFAKAGADIITIHAEAVKDAKSALRAIRALGRKAGLAIKPKTPVDEIVSVLDECDLALVMTVEPGFGGQAFMPEMLAKVKALRQAIDSGDLDCWLQVDGGVGLLNIAQAAEAGADSLVAGSSVFGVKDPAVPFRALEAKARAAVRSHK